MARTHVAIAKYAMRMREIVPVNEGQAELSAHDRVALSDRVRALSDEEQHKLAKILAADVYAWLVGDPMYSGENQSFVDSFVHLAPFVPSLRRQRLRVIYRGVRVDAPPADWLDGSAKQAVTSLKPLQSWSAKSAVAQQFTDGNVQTFTKGRCGVLFSARAKALPVLFTLTDLASSYLSLVDGLRYEAKDQWTSMSHSEFTSVYYDLERFAHQDEVIVLAKPGETLPIASVKVLD